MYYPLRRPLRPITEFVQIDNAYEGIDYRGKIERSQFEAASCDLMVRFVIPLQTCLVKAGLTFVRFQLIRCRLPTHLFL